MVGWQSWPARGLETFSPELALKPQREQSKVWERLAQVVQIAAPSPGRSPGRAWSWSHSGQVLRVRIARFMEIRPMCPSG